MDINQLKKLSKIGLAALFVLFIGAIVFYKERVFFGDASFIIFKIINRKTFEIQEHRYGSFVTQMIPYFGQIWHLPLKVLVVGYSISFNLFYLSVAAILHRCRQYAFTVLMALYYFLFASASYFWTNNEIHQAVAWMFLMFGLTAYLGTKKVNIFVTATVFSLLAFLTIFTHYVVIIPTFFLWVYLMIEKDRWPFSTAANILFSVLLAVIITAKFLVTADHSYDGNCLRSVTHVSFKDIYDAFTTPVIEMFVRRCVTNYWVGVVCLMLGIVGLVKTHRFRLLAWTLVSLVGYFIIMGLTYGVYDRDFSFFHIESEWASIGIIVGTPFVFTYLPKLRIQLAAGLLVVVFLVRLFYLGAAVPPFTWRTQFKEHVMSEMKKKGITKLALINDDNLFKKNIMIWAIAEESMMMSGLEGDNPQLSFRLVNNDEKELINDISATRGMSTVFGIIEPRYLNQEYFHIDTTRPYQIMTYEQLFK